MSFISYLDESWGGEDSTRIGCGLKVGIDEFVYKLFGFYLLPAFRASLEMMLSRRGIVNSRLDSDQILVGYLVFALL